MSRSYKAPVWTQGSGSKTRKEMKRKAARAVRAAQDLANGKAFKKLFCSWDICDWRMPDKQGGWKARRK